MERRLRSINKGAQIRRANRATVDVSFVTGVNMENTEAVIAEVNPVPPMHFMAPCSHADACFLRLTASHAGGCLA